MFAFNPLFIYCTQTYCINIDPNPLQIILWYLRLCYLHFVGSNCSSEESPTADGRKLKINRGNRLTVYGLWGF